MLSTCQLVPVDTTVMLYVLVLVVFAFLLEVTVVAITTSKVIDAWLVLVAGPNELIESMLPVPLKTWPPALWAAVA